MTRQQTLRFCTMLVVAVAVCGAGCSDSAKERSKRGGPKVELKTKFAPGDYVLTEVMDMDMSITAEGQTIPIAMSLTVGGDVGISRPGADGEQEVSFTCRRIRQSVTVPGRGKMEFDSEGGPTRQDATLAGMLRPLLGWGCTLTAKDGKFTGVPDAIQSLTERIASAGYVSSQQVSQLTQSMEPFLKEMLTRHWGELLPKEPVGVGDTWEGTIRVESAPMIGQMRLDCSCELEDIQDSPIGRLAVIAATGEVSIRDRDVETAVLGGPPMKMRIERLRADMTGKFEFNMDVGLSTRAKLREVLTMDMSIDTGSGRREKAKAKVTLDYDNTLAPSGAPKPSPSGQDSARAVPARPAGARPVPSGARQEAAKALVEQVIPSALQMYNMHIGRFPTEDEGGLKALVTKPTFADESLNGKWRGPYLTQEPKDPWDHYIHYEVVAPGTGDNTVSFKVWSDGPDGLPGTEDDITYPKSAAPGQ